MNPIADAMNSNPSCTARVTYLVGEEERTQLCTGFYKDLGAPVLGSLLDPEVDFPYEVGRTEFEVELVPCPPGVVKATVWTHAKHGQAYLLRDAEPAEAKDGYLYFRRGQNA